MKAKVSLLLLIITIFSGACAPTITSDSPKDLINISMSILPQQYFVERISGEKVSINVMVGPGDDPHTYEPTPKQMRALTEADIYFSIGVEFEEVWLQRFADINPQMLIIDTTENIERLPMSDIHEIEHEGETDPHVWLSPLNVLKISEQIYNGLVMIDPENEALYQENLESFRKEIEDLDLFIQNELSGLDNRQFIAYHPAWGYFAHEYQLEMLAVETGGQEPGAETLAQIITLAKTNDVRLIIMPLAYSSKNAETLAEEIDASVIILDPLAQDWLVGMQELANTLAGSMEN